MDRAELKRWLKKNGWNQSALARELGVHRVTVACWLSTSANKLEHPKWLPLALKGLGAAPPKKGKGK